MPPAAREALEAGSPATPAVAADVLAAQQRLLQALRDSGYALAKVDDAGRDRCSPARSALDVSYHGDRPGRASISARSRSPGCRT